MFALKWYLGCCSMSVVVDLCYFFVYLPRNHRCFSMPVLDCGFAASLTHDYHYFSMLVCCLATCPLVDSLFHGFHVLCS